MVNGGFEGKPHRSGVSLTDSTMDQPTMLKAFEGLSDKPESFSEDSWTPDGSSSVSDSEDAKNLGTQSANPAARNQGDGVLESSLSNCETMISTKGTGPQGKNRKRKKSIQIVIQETGQSSKYTLTTEDPMFQEIMQSGLRSRKEPRTSRPRSRPRDLVFTRQFTTFDRQNPSSQSPFHGFFTLFWLAMALLLARIAAGNYKTQGSVFGNSEILHLMIDRDLFVMLFIDLAMCVTTSFGFFLHKAIALDYMTWNGSGWIIQSLWQIFYTVGVIWITFWRDWPWTHTVFIVLHVFVLLMKQHAYSFYNGYLSCVYKRRHLLRQKLTQLDHIKPDPSPVTNLPDASVRSTGFDTPLVLPLQRSRGPKNSTNIDNEKSDISVIGQAIETSIPLNTEQIQAFHRVLVTEIAILDEELRGNCTPADKMYPNNLTLWNFCEWTCLPTLVYDLEYPRQEQVNWWYVAEKSAATLGVIWVMIIISQAYIYPVVVETVRQKEAGMSLDERWKEFPWVVSDMLFPMLLEQLLSWYVIWECLLNVLAEVTRFADRGFYGDWWNSVSFDQYARDWNRPVHNFLLRHVYHSSISFFRLSKIQATFFTFLLSAIVHEILMFCLFKKVRGYLFTFQLTQLPLAALSKTKFMKGRDTLGNVVFWFGLFIGPSVITSLYLIV